MQNCLRFLAALAGCLLVGMAALPRTARATTYTWSGGYPITPNDTWTSASNWLGQSGPVSAADTDLVFGAVTGGGTGYTTSNNNLADPFTLRSLLFTTDAPAYTLRGGALNLGSGGITVNGTATQTINNVINLTAAQT